MVRLAFEAFVDFARAFRDQEETACDENQVAAGERVPEQMEERSGQANDLGERGEQRDAREHGASQADATGAPLLLPREFARQDGNENDVVDAEDDLEHRQRQQAEPRFGIPQ